MMPAHDYGKYDPKEFKNIMRFGNDFLPSLMKFKEQFLEYIRSLIPAGHIIQSSGFVINITQLQEAASATLHDIKRCADFHNLFDAATGHITISEHRIAAFWVKWFMRFMPISVNCIFEDMSVMYRDATEFPENAPEQLYELSLGSEESQNYEKAVSFCRFVNESFALYSACLTIIGMDRNNFDKINNVEKERLLHTLKYRVCGMQGEELAILLYWLQVGVEGLGARCRTSLHP